MSSYTMQIFERLFRAKRNKSFFHFYCIFSAVRFGNLDVSSIKGQYRG